MQETTLPPNEVPSLAWQKQSKEITKDTSLLDELIQITERKLPSTCNHTPRSTITLKSQRTNLGLTERISKYISRVADKDKETSESGTDYPLQEMSDFTDSDCDSSQLGIPTVKTRTKPYEEEKEVEDTSATNTLLNTCHNTACNTIMEYDSEDGLTDSTSNLFVSRMEHNISKDSSLKHSCKNSVVRYSMDQVKPDRTLDFGVQISFSDKMMSMNRQSTPKLGSPSPPPPQITLPPKTLIHKSPPRRAENSKSPLHRSPALKCLEHCSLSPERNGGKILMKLNLTQNYLSSANKLQKKKVNQTQEKPKNDPGLSEKRASKQMRQNSSRGGLKNRTTNFLKENQNSRNKRSSSIQKTHTPNRLSKLAQNKTPKALNSTKFQSTSAVTPNRLSTNKTLIDADGETRRSRVMQEIINVFPDQVKVQTHRSISPDIKPEGSLSHSVDDNKASANLEKCLRSLSFIQNKITGLESDIVSGFHSNNLKEFHLNGFLRKLKTVEKTLVEIEDKVEKEKENRVILAPIKNMKRPKITATANAKEPKTVRKDPKKFTSKQKIAAYKKIKEFASKLEAAFNNKVKAVVKRLGATRETVQAKAVQRPFPKKNWNEVKSAPSIWDLNFINELSLKNVKSKALNQIVLGLIKQSNKKIATNLANYESRGTMELRLIMLYGGVKLVSTAEQLQLLKREHENYSILESKSSTVTAKIAAGLIAGPLQVLRRSEKQALTTLQTTEKLIEKEMSKSKREKTKVQLKNQLRNCLVWTGWSLLLGKQQRRARGFFDKAVELSLQREDHLLLDFGLFILENQQLEGSLNSILEFSNCSQLSSSNSSKPAIKKIDLLKMVHNCHDQMIQHPEQVKELIDELNSQDQKQATFMLFYTFLIKANVKTPVILSFIEQNIASFKRDITLYTYLRLHAQKLKTSLCKEYNILKTMYSQLGNQETDNVYLLFQFAKAIVRFNVEEHQEDAQAILEELQRAFKATPLLHNYQVSLSLSQFWLGRLYVNQHKHTLAAQQFKLCYEFLSPKKQDFVLLHQRETKRLEEIIRVAALNKDTIKKTAPAFSDLDPYWEEVLHLCLSKNELNLALVESLKQRTPSRLESWFLYWAAAYKKQKEINRQIKQAEPTSPLAHSPLEILTQIQSREFTHHHIEIEPSLLFRLIGKNYGDRLSFDNLLLLMRFKSLMQVNVKEAFSFIEECLQECSKTPYILHYFLIYLTVQALNVPHKTEIMAEIDMEKLELSVRKILDIPESIGYRKAKIQLVWAQLQYLMRPENEQEWNVMGREWKHTFRKARDLLLAQGHEQTLSKTKRVLDYASIKYKL